MFVLYVGHKQRLPVHRMPQLVYDYIDGFGLFVAIVRLFVDDPFFNSKLLITLCEIIGYEKFHHCLVLMLLMASGVQAQVEPNAGSRKPWLISSVKEFRLAAPSLPTLMLRRCWQRKKTSMMREDARSRIGMPAPRDIIGRN